MSTKGMSPEMVRVRDAVHAVVDWCDVRLLETQRLKHNRAAKKVAIFVAREYLRLPVAEIAAACGSNVNTVYVTLTGVRKPALRSEPFARSGGATLSFDGIVGLVVERLESEDGRRDAAPTGEQDSRSPEAGSLRHESEVTL